MKSTRPSILFVLLLAACGGTPPATPDSGSRPDAAATPDAAVVDANTGGRETGPAPDSGVDAAVVADTGVDAASGPDAAVDPCLPHTVVVTSGGGSYEFDGGPPNPTLTLCAGVTYTFDMTAVASFHPMEFRAGATTLMPLIPAGATTAYTVPASGAQPDGYVCTIHLFGGAVVVP